MYRVGPRETYIMRLAVDLRRILLSGKAGNVSYTRQSGLDVITRRNLGKTYNQILS